MAEFVVLGNFVVDLIGKPIDRLPERGGLLLLDTLETHVGGNGPNTAAALARLGARVAAVGRIGRDLYGAFLLEALRRFGVDTELVAADPERPSGITLVAVDRSGERSFLHHFGANARFGPDDLDWDRIGGARHLHLGGFFVLPAMDGLPAARVLQEARRRGLSTSLDVCWDHRNRWLEAVAPCLPHADLFFPSEEEGRHLTGRERPEEIAAALRDAGARTVVLKRGERGCYYAGDEGCFAMPAFRVPVRDTTGAGDCFIAGFLYGRAAGWDLLRTLRFANACGARSVAAVGAVTGLASAAEVQAWADAQPLREGEDGADR